MAGHWIAIFKVTGMTRPGKFPTARAGTEPRIFRSRGGRLNPLVRDRTIESTTVTPLVMVVVIMMMLVLVTMSLDNHGPGLAGADHDVCVPSLRYAASSRSLLSVFVVVVVVVVSLWPHNAQEHAECTSRTDMIIQHHVLPTELAD